MSLPWDISAQLSPTQRSSSPHSFGSPSFGSPSSPFLSQTGRQKSSQLRAVTKSPQSFSNSPISPSVSTDQYDQSNGKGRHSRVTTRNLVATRTTLHARSREQEFENETLDEKSLELIKLQRDPFDYIRKKISQQVEDCLWQGNLEKLYNELSSRQKSQPDKQGKYIQRCLVCTLPVGTCKHTEQWAAEKYDKAELKKHTLDIVDREIGDMLDIMGTTSVVETSHVASEVNIHGMKWSMMEVRPSDKIGNYSLSLSAPTERGWHSCTLLMDSFLVVFGGFRYKKTGIPQPFSTAPRHEDIEYLSDVVVYDLANMSWHDPRIQSGTAPPPRYGHCATSLGDNRMLVFGGRGASGRFLSDAWIFDVKANTWDQVPIYDTNALPPSPRVFAAAVNDGSDVFLFGGTDGVENFGDLWVFKGGPHQMKWERIVAVGPPPSPRYGHRMILLEPGRAAILGGCAVNPQSEIVGSGLSIQETKTLFDLSHQLQKCYVDEGVTADLGGRVLEHNILHQKKDMRALYKGAADIAGRVYAAEQSTREVEKMLVQSFHTSQASKNLKIQKAKHPDMYLDILFLSTRDLCWKPQIFPPLRGLFPTSRMHFGCMVISGFLLVIGGCKPTSLSHSVVDVGHSHIHTLDLATMQWSMPNPVQSADFLDKPLRIADADIIRAKHRIESEIARGLAAGAKGGRTVEVAEAEAVLEVCRWRKRTLLAERNGLLKPPKPRWGATLTRVGQRGVYLGGWDPEAVVARNEAMTLDLEDDLERQRRLDDEFTARLKREKNEDDEKNSLQKAETAYEMRAAKEAELKNEAQEIIRMSIEEICSCMPPLYKPSPVRCVKKNCHTMWLEWDRVYRNADNREIDPSSVVYMLFVKNSYQHLIVEDRVKVTPNMKRILENIEAAKELAKKKKPTKATQDKSSLSILIDDEIDGENDLEPEDLLMSKLTSVSGEKITYPGEIVAVRKNGLFDVAYDDGTFESGVPRSRISLFLQSHELQQSQAELVQRGQIGIAMRQQAWALIGPLSIIAQKRIDKKAQKKKMALHQLVRYNPKRFGPRPEDLLKSRKSRGKKQQSVETASGTGTGTTIALSASRPGTGENQEERLRRNEEFGLTDADLVSSPAMVKKIRGLFGVPNLPDTFIGVHNFDTSKPNGGDSRSNNRSMEDLFASLSSRPNSPAKRKSSSVDFPDDCGTRSRLASREFSHSRGRTNSGNDFEVWDNHGSSSPRDESNRNRSRSSSRVGQRQMGTSPQAEMFETLGMVAHTNDSDARNLARSRNSSFDHSETVSRRRSSSFGRSRSPSHDFTPSTSRPPSSSRRRDRNSDSDNDNHPEHSGQLQIDKFAGLSRSEFETEDSAMEKRRALKHGLTLVNGRSVKGKQRVTIQPGPEWKLLYVGNDCSYACTNLVPQETIDNEPDISVQVEFSLQIRGLDFPIFEHSQMSSPAVYFTSPPETLLKVENNDSDDSDLSDEDNKSSSSAMTGRSSPSFGRGGSSSFSAVSGGTFDFSSAVGGASNASKSTSKLANKLKKEMLSTMVGNSHVIQIQKERNVYSSTGISSHYL